MIMTERKYPTRDSGPMYNFPMPTETLRGQLTEVHAMIDAALALHKPVLEGVQGDLPDGSYGYIEPACSTCGDADAHGVPWPCDTAKALGVTD
jgi:hypothetical protein